MSTTSGCQDTRIKKIEFVARTHLLYHQSIFGAALTRRGIHCATPLRDHSLNLDLVSWKGFFNFLCNNLTLRFLDIFVSYSWHINIWAKKSKYNHKIDFRLNFESLKVAWSEPVQGQSSSIYRTGPSSVPSMWWTQRFFMQQNKKGWTISVIMHDYMRKKFKYVFFFKFSA